MFIFCRKEMKFLLRNEKLIFTLNTRLLIGLSYLVLVENKNVL